MIWNRMRNAAHHRCIYLVLNTQKENKLENFSTFQVYPLNMLRSFVRARNSYNSLR